MIIRRTLLIGFVGALAGCNSLQGPLPNAEFLGDLSEVYTRYNFEKAEETAVENDYDAPPRPAKLARKIVPHAGPESAGTIVVKTKERQLYLVLDDGTAIVYPVGVGKAGRQWQGEAEIDGAYVRPAWAPTPEIREENPDLPDVIPGGSPHNPMGARALTLSGGKYAIHGTNRPESIGTYASYGCIRMFNDDVVDLFNRVNVGTSVIVTL
jgi:lipoprotein-anchoring transpeptidase ErfK/SrfK